MQESSVSAQSHHLPQQFTSFVGREEELAEICQRLADPTCRLLTLVGPGGMGKTRLAVQATAVLTEQFPDGTYFVNLQPVRTAEYLITAVADTLDISLSGQDSPLNLLLTHLADQQILLTLDNFEQLLDAAPILSELLNNTPVKILVTTRETLNLQEEWLYPLHGMTYPTETMSANELAHFSAVQLFADRAKRTHPDFSWQHEAAAVAHICQLVEGMPLALELAAPWIKTLSAQEIAAEIERNRDFLASRLRNVPERHRSLHAIFAQTWENLTPQEQDVFQRLSVFRGGFLRAAATAVADASLPLLSSLLDKSLLRWESDEGGHGRYQIHELLRQYAEEKLQDNPETAVATLSKHAHYYATFLGERLEDLLGGRQHEAMLEIEAELNNVRAAWQWAIDQQEIDMLLRMGSPLNPFYWYQTRFHEARDAYTAAVASLEVCPPSPKRDLVLAATLTNQGWFMLAANGNEVSLPMAERSLAIYEQLGATPVAGLDTDPRLIMGIVYRHSDRGPQAIKYFQATIAEAERQNHLMNLQCAHRLLAQSYHMINELDLAEEHARIAHEIVEQKGDLWGAAYDYDTMGRIAVTKGEYEVAEQILLAGYALHSQLRFAQGRAEICLQLADLYLCQGNDVAAKKFTAEGLALYQESKTSYGIIGMHARLAHAALLAQELETARIQLLQALDDGIGYEDNFPDILWYTVVITADLTMRRGDADTAHRWLSAAVASSYLWRIHQDYAAELLDDWQTKEEAARWQTAVQAAASLTLTEVLAEMSSALQTPLAPEGVAGTQPAAATAVAANQAPIEPLPNHELEVLQLIAAGLSNQQVADQLIISKGTVKYYTSHIYSKLQVSSRTQAVATARELGLLSPE